MSKKELTLKDVICDTSKYFTHYKYCCNVRGCDNKDAIKVLEQRWIPVSEKLPNEFESVLVCYKSQGGIAQAVSERLVNMDGSNRWSALAGVEPIAWMPLPVPFQADKGIENE